MHGIEPQFVQNKDIITWFHQSLLLIQRRFLSYIGAVVLFFATLFIISQAIQSVQHAIPSLLLLIIFLAAAGFVFYFFIAGLTMISHCSDHSQYISMRQIMQYFLPSQKTFLKLTLVSILLGLFYWVVSVQLKPDTNIFEMSDKAIAVLTDGQSTIFYVFKTGAVFLYFILLAMFSLRTFFSTSLVIFHELNFHEARQLSQRALIKNIRTMGNVLIIWFVVLLVSMVFVPPLTIALLPLFTTFGYVAYRHIFLGQGLNKKAHQLTPVTASGY